MLKLLKWKKKATGTVTESQRNLAGHIITAGEFVKIRRSKEDPHLIDIISVAKPKRIIRNVTAKCVRDR